MSLNDTASAERIHIGFFGRRNAGKSSLVNAVTNQEMSVVSEIKGTTTDTVRKAMELLPLGPVVIIDTPGIDDEGVLGEKRVAAANRVLHSCDIAVLCVECGTAGSLAGMSNCKAEEQVHLKEEETQYQPGYNESRLHPVDDGSQLRPDEYESQIQQDVCESELHLDEYESQLVALFKKREIPYIIALTKCDLNDVSDEEYTSTEAYKKYIETGAGKEDSSLEAIKIDALSATSKSGLEANTDEKYSENADDSVEVSDNKAYDKGACPLCHTSAVTGLGIEELKVALGKLLKDRPERTILSDIVKPGEAVILVVPIDASAPKGRLILPQQLVLRELLDIGAMAFVTKETELLKTLELMKEPPALVVTDSQVFHYVKDIIPENVPLTSFSILMARYNGFLEPAVEGALLISELPENARILIAEGCTHHRQCEDIGTVKLPKLLTKFTGKQFHLEWSSGRSYPEDLDTFDLVLHCGGCMLNEREMQYRMRAALDAGVPFTNYGIAIAHMNGILERSVAMLPQVSTSLAQ